MNEKHRLDAPNDETLSGIEQLGNRSDLSSLYPEPKKGWDGDLMAADKREAKRSQQLQNYTQSIRRQFLQVGVLLSTPPATTIVLVGLLSKYVWPNQDNRGGILLGILAVAVFLLASFFSLRQLNRLFYNHTLRLLPFLIITWLLLGISIQTAFILLAGLFSHDPLLASLIIAAICIVWGVTLAAIILVIWTSSRLSSSSKMGIVALISIIHTSVVSMVSLLQIF